MKERLEDMVKEKLFRDDLFYRLNVLRLSIPPLRERMSDLPLLIQFLLEKICERNERKTPEISADALKKLMNYSFPGNIRELENILERSVILGPRTLIAPEDILIETGLSPTQSAPASADALPDFDIRKFLRNEIQESESGHVMISVLGKLEKEVLKIALNINQFNKRKTADMLGINRVTLDKKIKEHQIFEI